MLNAALGALGAIILALIPFAVILGVIWVVCVVLTGLLGDPNPNTLEGCLRIQAEAGTPLWQAEIVCKARFG